MNKRGTNNQASDALRLQAVDVDLHAELKPWLVNALKIHGSQSTANAD